MLAFMYAIRWRKFSRGPATSALFLEKNISIDPIAHWRSCMRKEVELFVVL